MKAGKISSTMQKLQKIFLRLDEQVKSYYGFQTYAPPVSIKLTQVSMKNLGRRNHVRTKKNCIRKIPC